MPLRISQFQVALSHLDVPLDNMTYNDPLMQSLPWFVLVSTPTDLSPGETRTFDVPEAPDILGQGCYARAQFGNPGDPPLGATYKISPGTHLPLPALAGSGLFVLMLVLQGAGLVYLIRNRVGDSIA